MKMTNEYNKKIKLVIFDLDGVLVDACEWHRIALNHALKDICDHEISLKDHVSIFNGLPTRTKLQKLTDMGVISIEDHEAVYTRKQSLVIQTIKDNAKIDKTKISLMKYLKNNGCYIACFTNSIRETALLMLEMIGVLDYLDIIVTNQDVSQAKPDPEGYNLIVNKFNQTPENVVIVEDSPKGKKAAYASDCNVIEVINSEVVNIDLFANYLR